MPSFKPPTFQERTTLAANAKQAALEMLRTRVSADKAGFAARQDARAAREAAEAQRRYEKRETLERQKVEKEALATELREMEASIPVLSDAERKAARDARYGRRKGRVSS
jgi:hypothetical protein